MSRYDNVFIESLKKILDPNKRTEYKSRAVWKDTGEKATCYKVFGLINEYNDDFSNTPPVGTIRKFPIKTCIDELLWIWQKKSNNIKDLNSHVWDDWADENGSIGAAYGFQVRSKLRKVEYVCPTTSDNWATAPATRSVTKFLDQTDFVLHELKHNPFSRRIITNLYAIDENQLMGLDPCCYMCTWNVTVGADGKKYLNLLLNQRSQDMIAANNWNVFQYYILQNMFAQCTGLEVGKLTHVIADAHIYDRHVEIAEQMIDLADQAHHDPVLDIAYTGDNFYSFIPDDFKLVDYKYCTDIKNIPIAV